MRSNYGAKLNDIKIGSKIGIQLIENGNLQLIIDGVREEETLPGVLPSNQPVYAFFDLYGQCQQVSYKVLQCFGIFTRVFLDKTNKQ